MVPKYMVAVIGGACAGSEIASQLAAMNMDVVVFEQSALPYGKIEDGLPRWHQKLQNKEKEKIDQKLTRQGIYFVPNCAFGKDISLEDLQNTWQIPLIVLANGAWRDRELRVEGIDSNTVGLVYQNAFVYWFNHYHEANYSGPVFEVPQGPVIIGGGLASIDVAKICQYELAKAVFARYGVSLDVVSYDHYGIFKLAEKHGIPADAFDFKPARIYYRKRIKDMPLVPLGENPSEQKLEKAKLVRAKLVANATQKYGFEVHPLRSPVKVDCNDDGISAVHFAKNQYDEGALKLGEETKVVQTPMVISSIGSIPQPLPGIPMRGELYEAESYHTGALKQLKGVYCVGNAITGRGNIKESHKNAARLGSAIEASLSDQSLDFEKWFQVRRNEAQEHVEILKSYLDGIDPMSIEVLDANRVRIKELQVKRSYEDGYLKWRNAILAAR